MKPPTMARLMRGATVLTVRGLLPACAMLCAKTAADANTLERQNSPAGRCTGYRTAGTGGAAYRSERAVDHAGRAALAVLNDPRLQAARDQAGVARAQAFAAGLLPDPKFSASRDIPQGQSGATSTAYSLGLRFDLGGLITRRAAVAAARAKLRQVNLQILWQEWQTAAAAKMDYIALVGLRDRDALLETERYVALNRFRRDLSAAGAGIQPRTMADADLVELQQLQQTLAGDARRHESRLAALDGLLGLRPEAPLRRAGLPRFDQEAVKGAAAPPEPRIHRLT